MIKLSSVKQVLILIILFLSLSFMYNDQSQSVDNQNDAKISKSNVDSVAIIRQGKIKLEFSEGMKIVYSKLKRLHEQESKMSALYCITEGSYEVIEIKYWFHRISNDLSETINELSYKLYNLKPDSAMLKLMIKELSSVREENIRKNYYDSVKWIESYEKEVRRIFEL